MLCIEEKRDSLLNGYEDFLGRKKEEKRDGMFSKGLFAKAVTLPGRVMVATAKEVYNTGVSGNNKNDSKIESNAIKVASIEDFKKIQAAPKVNADPKLDVEAKQVMVEESAVQAAPANARLKAPEPAASEAPKEAGNNKTMYIIGGIGLVVLITTFLYFKFKG